MKFKLSLGPITYKYGKEYGLRKREKGIVIIIGLLIYGIITGIGFVIGLDTFNRLMISIIIPIIIVIGLKRYYMYQYAKSKREKVES